MLSTRQAHHILQLSERHGAKVVFAGDTRQQQPVEAGPGLRLIRDVAGSIRVDRIRRQKADLEDVLVHVHEETPEQARFRAGLTSPQERDAILADYEAMDRKPSFTPWQVAVSEALRDGEAGKAIAAWHLRNRLHLCHDEEKTLTRLVIDYDRGETAARSAVHDYLAAAERHVKACEPLRREAESQGVHVAEVAGWPEWRQGGQLLERAGRAILADEDTYGAYLDAVAAGKPRARLTVDQLRSRIEDGSVEAAESEKAESGRDRARSRQEGIAWILDDPEKLRELREQLKKRERTIGRHMRKSRGLSM